MNKTSDQEVGHVMAKTKWKRWFVDAEGECYRLFLLRRKEKLRSRWTSASFKKVFTLIYPLMHTRGRSSHHSDSRSSGRTVASCPCAKKSNAKNKCA